MAKKPPKPAPAKETPPSSRWWITLVGIFAVALVLRIVHLAAIGRAPFVDVLMGDGRAYDLWAQRIAAGEWIGRNVFYQAPLYPYLLGTLYAAFGRSLALVRAVQALLGAGACVLLADAGRRLFSPRVGTAAGLALALYAPALFFDGLVQKAAVDAFLLCLSLWMVARIGGGSPARRAWLEWGALGLVLGALALTRENALVLVLVLAGWAFARETDRSRGLRRSGALLAGVAIVLAPVIARNALVGGGFYITTSQLGPNLYIGNHAGADGNYQSLRYGRGDPEFERTDATELAEQAEGRALTPVEVSRYWTGRALAFVTGSPGEWLALMGRKTALLLNRTEMMDTEDPAIHAEWSPLLRALRPIGHFGVLLPLAAFGVVLAWPERRRHGVVLVLALAYGASVVAFYVLARYRYPLVPFLILFAAVGIVGMIDLARARRRPALGSVGIVAAAALFANWPTGSAAGMRAVGESNLGVALQSAGRTAEAAEHYRRAIEAYPDYAPAHANLASALRDLGQWDEAAAEYRRAIELEPLYATAHYNLGNLLLDRGDPQSAVPHFEAALAEDSSSVAARNNLGIALAQLGRGDDAIALFRRATELDPAAAAGYRNLGRALMVKGDGPGAIDAFTRAARLEPGNVDARYELAAAHNALGIALGEQGNLTDAIAEFSAAIELRPDYEDAKRNLTTALGMAAGRRR